MRLAKMTNINLIYLNRFNETKAYEVEIIEKNSDYYDVYDLREKKVKTFNNKHDQKKQQQQHLSKHEPTYLPNSIPEASGARESLPAASGASKNEKSEPKACLERVSAQFLENDPSAVSNHCFGERGRGASSRSFVQE